MRRIEDVLISTDAMVGFLGVSHGAFAHWVAAGLLKHRKPGHGRPAGFDFRDILSVFVVKHLIQIGFARAAAVKFAGHCDPGAAFMRSGALVVPLRDGNLVEDDSDFDPAAASDAASIVIDLDAFGRHLAQWLAHHLVAQSAPAGGHAGPAAFEAAMRHFEDRLEKARR